MITSRRREANQKNAKKSTGPKTSAGRRRSSLNALKYGLSIPIASHPDYSSEIEQLAGLISGEVMDQAMVEVARDIASAHIELRRISLCEKDILTNPRHHVKLLTEREIYRRERKQVKIIKMITDLWVAERGPENTDEIISYLFQAYHELDKAPEPLPFEESLHIIVPKLASLDRYRLRAFSRLTRAIKAFHALKLSKQLL